MKKLDRTFPRLPLHSSSRHPEIINLVFVGESFHCEFVKIKARYEVSAEGCPTGILAGASDTHMAVGEWRKGGCLDE